jgi:predicted enzyme related to lactoylglutathione lyase
MPSPIDAGLVVYATDLARMGAFYAAVTDLRLVRSEPGHLVLESGTFQLVILAVKAEVAAAINLADPPTRREDTALKPVFFVASIDAVRALVSEYGGELNPERGAWRFGDWLVCDGHDPEGNVIQLRQPHPRRQTGEPDQG